jgi:hypothetical protein
MTVLRDVTILLGKKMCQTTILIFRELLTMIKKMMILTTGETSQAVVAVAKAPSAAMKKIVLYLLSWLELVATWR